VKVKSGEIISVGKSGQQIQMVHFGRVTTLPYQNQYLVLRSPCGQPQENNFLNIYLKVKEISY
jgi:hypothetical protein